MRNLLLFSLTLLFSSSIKANEKQWDFRISPYAWFAGFEGVVNTFDSKFPSYVNISPSEALNDSDSAFALIVDAKNQGHGVYADYFYSNSLFDDEVAPVLGISVRSRTKTTIVTLAYEKEWINNEAWLVDVMFGSRWWQINSAAKLYKLEDNISRSSTEQWLDPYIGIKGIKAFANSKFFLSGGASMGGFGLNADMFYDANINVGYQWTSAISTAIGYRHFELYYDKNNFIYDVRQAGWQIDLTWNF